MAGELIGQVVLESAFSELLKAVSNGTKATLKFNSMLDQLKNTLRSIKPIFDEIAKLNKLLDSKKNETVKFVRQLQEGEKLVQKCSVIQWWNLFKKYKYSKKLLKLEESIRRFFQIDLQIQLWRDRKKILVGVGDVDGKVDEILAILKRGGSIGFSGACCVPGLPEYVFGLDEPLRHVKLMLLKDNVSVVVISGPGGSGKTTLAKMLCHVDEIEDIFGKNILFVNVSQNISIQGVVQKIFLHMNYHMFGFQSDEDAINQLESLLKQIWPYPILLILDDVWPKAESLVQKFMFRISGFKILVTSRSEFSRFEHTYKLKLLNAGDAMALFQHTAFPQRGSFNVANDVVTKIVEGCKGLPLALIVIGGMLRGKPELSWVSILKKWSEGQSVFDSSNELLDCLQTSLDALDEMQIVKECYLDFGSFPEDQKIPASTLMDLWVEMYDLDDEGMYSLECLVELSTRNLVNLILDRKDVSGFSGYCNGHLVMQHDLLRELAIHQSNLGPIEQRKRLIMDLSKNNFPKWWIEQRQQPLNARLLSIFSDETFCGFLFPMNLPQVQSLILNFQSNDYTLPIFIEGMDQLKVLIVANCGFSMAKLNNLHLLGCSQNLKRVRLERVSVSSLSTAMLQLMNLKKISFIMCEIKMAFDIPASKGSLVWPTLKEIEIEYCDDLEELPIGLCNISHLEKLSIICCPELVTIPDEFGNLKNLELLNLHSCTKLLELPASIGSLQKLKFLDISDCLSLSKLPQQFGKLTSLSMLHMRGCQGLYELPPTMINLEKLEDVICDEEMSYLWESYQIYLTKLKVNVLKGDINLNWLHKLPS